jgi:hypothetical protein
MPIALMLGLLVALFAVLCAAQSQPVICGVFRDPAIVRDNDPRLAGPVCPGPCHTQTFQE